MSSPAGSPPPDPDASRGLSATQRAVIAHAPAEMQPILRRKMKMQSEQEVRQLITLLMNQMRGLAMTLLERGGR